MQETLRLRSSPSIVLRVVLLAVATFGTAVVASGCRSPAERAALRAERDRRRAVRAQLHVQELEGRRAMQAAADARVAEQNRAREAQQAEQLRAAQAARSAELQQLAQQCRSRNFAACIDAAVAYRDGVGVAVNDGRVVELYTVACSGRDMRGCIGLGWMAEQGRGMARSYTAAVRWYTRACNAGDGLACNNLALLHEGGRGVPQNMQRAQSFFRVACERGHAPSCARVQTAAPVASVQLAAPVPSAPAAVVIVQSNAGACDSGFYNSEGRCCPHAYSWQGAMNCCAQYRDGQFTCWNPNPQPIVQAQVEQPAVQAQVVQTGLLIGGRRANWGSMTLSPNFMPDPATRSVISGGDIDARTLNLGGMTCHGFVTRQPDFILQLRGPTPFLRFYVRGAQGSDATLIINDGASQWHCDDDGGGNLNPVVDISNAPAGQYDVWVGSYRAGENAPSVLHVTELASNRP